MFLLLCYLHMFFLLFPYTTLFRSRHPLPCGPGLFQAMPPGGRVGSGADEGAVQEIAVREEGHGEPAVGEKRPGPRSEEHTSELQSPMYLVCRLLLEKKTKNLLIYS